MISVVIPTLNAEQGVARTLSALVPALVDGLVREAVVADGGSTDATAEVVDAAGARFLAAPRGRGPQLAAGAAVAKGPWLLFLHADTVPGPGWIEETGRFLASEASRVRAAPASKRPLARAAAYRFALDDVSPAARRLERAVAWRCRLFKLPYGDQGLLIRKDHYARLGGFRPLPLMEDVDFVRRILREGGRDALTLLEAPAVTSAARYLRDGYLKRSARNLALLSLYFMKVPPERLARLYG